MSKRVAVLLAPGFEEAEAIIVIDVLRRLNIGVDMLACQTNREVISYHNIPMKADALLSEQSRTLYDAIVLPGGPQGSRNLGADAQVLQFVQHHLDAEKLVSAICSAGAHVLAANKLLQGRRYVCSGDNYKLYEDGQYVDQPVVEDGNVLTGKGLGLAFQFAFALGAKLVGTAAAAEHAAHIYVA